MLAVRGNVYNDRGVVRTAFPRPVLMLPPRVPPRVPPTEDRVGELFDANPSIEADPSILLDPDQPYPDINHDAPSSQSSKEPDEFPQQSVAAPSGVGSTLGKSGTETGEFHRKCLSCCRVTRKVLKPWSNSPTHACNACRLNMHLNPTKIGKCKEGKPLGYRDTPTKCFFERCHQMLLARTRSCMCFWDNRASGSRALAS